MDKSLHNRIKGEADWGENLGRWIFSGLFNFSITPRFDTLLAIQMRTRPNYGLTDFSNQNIYYQAYELQDEGGNRRVLFYRVGLITNFKLR